jgi:hypothetical protein
MRRFLDSLVGRLRCVMPFDTLIGGYVDSERFTKRVGDTRQCVINHAGRGSEARRIKFEWRVTIRLQSVHFVLLIAGDRARNGVVRRTPRKAIGLIEAEKSQNRTHDTSRG